MRNSLLSPPATQKPTIQPYTPKLLKYDAPTGIYFKDFLMRTKYEADEHRFYQLMQRFRRYEPPEVVAEWKPEFWRL